jgi:tetratricopeptide (TPR) repeat protein
VAENSRIEELRRRVESDPASIAFAQLAEEFRRAGRYDDAVRVCRGGLSKHPTYLSARVTLGRALIELGRCDEAQAELEYVLRAAPENLAAIRGLGEIHQRQGNLAQALRQYQIALALAKHDPELEEAVLDLNQRLGSASSQFDVSPSTQTDPGVLPPSSASALAGVQSGDRRVAAPSSSAPAVIPLSSLSPELEAAADEFTKALQALDELSLDLPGAAALESSPPPPIEDDERVSMSPATNGLPAKEQAVVDELESWLQAIMRRRSARDAGATQ